MLGLRLLTVYGGVSLQRQIQALRRGIDVVVATPGRLQDLVRHGACSLDAVDIAVLDEADHMADMGFLPAVTWLLDRVPPGGQRLLFSATLDGQVDTLVRRYLADPVRHVVLPTAAATARMDHQIRTVQATDKVAVAAELAARPGRTLLFVRTKHRAARLARQLDRAGLRAGALHGDLAQPARTRALAAFAAGTVRVLVATDIAARGIHVDGIDLVVTSTRRPNPRPTCTGPEHRRAGAAGTVVTLVLPEQATEVANLHRRAGVAAPPLPADPTPPRTRPGPTRAAPAAAGAVAAWPHPADHTPPGRGGRAMTAFGKLTWNEAMERGHAALIESERLYDDINASEGRSNLDIEKHLRRSEVKATQARAWFTLAGELAAKANGTATKGPRGGQGRRAIRSVSWGERYSAASQNRRGD